MTLPDIPSLTRRIGQEIFARVGSGPVPFSSDWLDDRLMGLTMANEAVKLQLFRFVDVLPQLDSPADIVRHLREYFHEARDHLPTWIKAALYLLPSSGPPAALLAWFTRFLHVGWHENSSRVVTSPRQYGPSNACPNAD
jgi:RHH-type proline utilization regulon transcriptional repressor/proline dehydrogenase/delta 1-pyrroline-5-carboxylate dehydrogenase